MRRKVKNIIATLLSLAIFINLFSNIHLANDKVSQMKTEKYPILEAYLSTKNKSTISLKENKKLRIIVEVDSDKIEEVREELSKFTGVKFHYTYKTLFKGFSLDFPHSEISKLKNIDGVKRIRPSRRLYPQTMNAKRLTEVMEAKQQYQAVYGLDGKLDGRGMLIATLDSGVDLDHPDMRIDEDAKERMKLKDIKFPFTEKVPYAFNYFNANHHPINEPAHTNPHGMHVAGILSGNSPEENGFKGIAPNAQLLVYKVISYDKSTADTDPNEIKYIGEDAQYNAMEDAILRGADVISLSIGSYGAGSEDHLWQTVLENANKKGVVVVAAMGN